MTEAEKNEFEALKAEKERIAKKLAQFEAKEKKKRERLNKQIKARNYWRKRGFWLLVGYIFGGDAKQSFKKIGQDIDARKIPKAETITIAVFHLLWRFMRVTLVKQLATIVTVSFVLIEVWLLLNQNALLKQQNELVVGQNKLLAKQNEFVSKQTNMAEKQTALFEKQNDLVREQNQLVMEQSGLLKEQNGLVRGQTDLSAKQNKLVEQQNALSEAGRRSSLVLLMSNIEDKIAEELRDSTNKNRLLSSALVGRIVALCNNLKPYRYSVEGDTLSKLLSPERGQMLISLVNAELGKATYDSIFAKANFEYADLQKVDFSGRYLNNIKLPKANLVRAILDYASMEGADLIQADMRHVYISQGRLSNARLKYVKLNDAYLQGIDLTGAHLGNTDLQDAHLENAILNEADLRSANLEGADFTNSQLNLVKISGSNIAKYLSKFVKGYEEAGVYYMKKE